MAIQLKIILSCDARVVVRLPSVDDPWGESSSCQNTIESTALIYEDKIGSIDIPPGWTDKVHSDFYDRKSVYGHSVYCPEHRSEK